MLRWSWEQCTGDERRLWAQLSLFAGPASLRAIVGVCGFGESASALDTVDKLVQQSLLVRAEAAGEASFGMTGRIGEPDDIAAAICTITSETAGWITAQRIEASGGQSL
ncbi:MAG: hypothetical protein QOK26_1244 [Pseudonocardiales bacterium]|nr:hypothetical protein [Pseudonocardiales bacterium]